MEIYWRTLWKFIWTHLVKMLKFKWHDLEVHVSLNLWLFWLWWEIWMQDVFLTKCDKFTLDECSKLAKAAADFDTKLVYFDEYADLLAKDGIPPPPDPLEPINESFRWRYFEQILTTSKWIVQTKEFKVFTWTRKLYNSVIWKWKLDGTSSDNVLHRGGYNLRR